MMEVFTSSYLFLKTAQTHRFLISPSLPTPPRHTFSMNLRCQPATACPSVEEVHVPLLVGKRIPGVISLDLVEMLCQPEQAASVGSPVAI